MSKRFRFCFILLLLFIWSPDGVRAQASFASEAELIKQAAKLFEEEEYEKASPLYAQLVSNYLKDPNYNFRLGVCLLYTSSDKEKAIPYLELALGKPDIVEKEVYYYLGRAYHLNYRFDDAINQYRNYMKVASAKNIDKLEVQRQMEMCVNGKKLLHNLSDLVVTEKKEMNKLDFFRSYDITEIGGKLLIKPEEKEFKTPIDKKKKEQSIIYLAKNKSQVYFSSYGLEGMQGKDIYSISKLPSKDTTGKSPAEWGKPQLLSSVINTKYDEDFPFLHPNGKVLYFSSKGHNSMGGYDIFKSKFNEETKTWGAPENMDFPINTPDDDILYVTDSSEKEAYFSSARASVAGKISVYHINVDRKPLDVVIIKGNVIKNRNNQALDVKITVKDLASNTILGIYNSSSEDGAYSLDLPNGGSFSFTVESAAFPTQSDVVIVPVQYKFSPMKQEISFDLVTSRMKITNSFGKTNEDENYLLALNYIKNKSKMDVSLVDLSPIDSSKKETETEPEAVAQKTGTATGDKKLTNEDIVKIAYEDAKDVDTEAKELKEQADISLNFANQKNELAQTKSKEASALLAEASKTDDIVKKEEYFDKADLASTEAKKLNQETVAAFNLAKKLDAVAFKKQEEADLSLQYAKGMEVAIKSPNPTEALAKIEEQEKKLEELSKENTGTSSISSGLKAEADTKQREVNKAIQTSTDIKQEMADNETVIANLKVDLEKTKNEELKQGIDNQISELSQENTYKKTELKQNEDKVAKLQKEYEGILNETEMVNNVINQSKTESNESASAGVASIDKTKLEKQVNSISGTTPVASTTVSPASPVVASTNKPAAKTSESTTPVTPAKPEPVVASASKPTAKATESVTVTPTVKTTEVKPAPAVVASTDMPATKATESVTATPPVKTTEVKPTPTVVASTDKPATKVTESVTPTPVKSEPIVVASTEKPATTITENIPPVKTTEVKPVPAFVASTNKPAAKATETVTPTPVKSEPTVVAFTEKPTAKVTEVAPAKTTEVKPVPAAVVASTEKPNAKVTEVAPVKTTTNTEAVAVTSPEKTSTKPVENPTPAIASATKPAENTATLPVINKTETKPVSTVKPIVTTSENPKPETVAAVNKTETAETKAISEDFASINKKNENELALADKIEDKEDREIVKASVYQNWSKEIDDAATKQKQNLDKTKDPASKALLAKRIDEEEVISKEKQAKSKGSIAVVAAPKPTSTGVTSVVPPATPAKITPVIASNPPTETPKVADKDDELEKINKGNAADYAVAEQIPNKKDREAAKAAAMKMWVQEINDHKESLQKNYFSETDANKKSMLAQQIAAAEKSSKERAASKSAVVEEPTVSGNSPVTLVAGESFTTNSAPIYSEEKPIPINDKLPEGIIYKVQIGAFRKAIRQDVFVGMNPIMGETTPQGFIRYTAGIFKSMSTADKIKIEIKKLGYKDAFVVAFYNGRRIPLKEASDITGETAGSSQAVALGSNKETPALSIKQLQDKFSDIDPSKNPTTKNATAQNQTPGKDIAPSENILSIGGLFYTVQVGVFANAVPSNKLYNIQPLYTETAPNGNLRYNVGIYNNLERAAEAKFMSIDVGLKDSYVTAYYNKKRISMLDAAKYAQDGEMVFSKDPNLNVLPYFGAGQKINTTEKGTDVVIPTTPKAAPAEIKNETAPATTTNNALAEKAPATSDNQIYASTYAADVEFKVQLGAFQYEVPLDIVNNFLKISRFGVENYKDENGMTIFTAGDFKSYDDATKLKKELVADTFKDAFVVAYRKGKKISLNEAKIK